MTLLPAAFVEAGALFAASWLLAQVEIQIEGRRGWAEDLPTWRLADPWILRLTNGKPVTGYHVYLTAFLVAVLHLPLLFTGFSRLVEARVLSFYFLMTITWDFQWFAWNPAWGLKRFFTESIWWFPRKVLGFPAEYYTGAAASFLATALLWREGAARWFALSMWVMIASAVSAAVAECGARPKTSGSFREKS